MKPSEVIREMKCALLEHGRSRHFFRAPDGRMCLLGAADFAVTGNAYACSIHAEPALTFIRQATGTSELTTWNSYASDDAVFDALDKAEKLALIAEES